MTPALIHALGLAKDLCDRIMIDEGGLPAPAPAGNGGLLSRETLIVASNLRKALLKVGMING